MERMTNDTRTAYRGCPLCEAGCGLEITLRGAPGSEEVVRIRGDRDDVFSHGFICPKGSTLKQLHEDPDRVRTPLVRRNGALEPATWDEAFAEIERRLLPIIEEHGRDAVGVYLGNPTVHNIGSLLYGRLLLKALGTGNLFSASTVDQRPKEISAGLMFGHQLSIPVPDLDRTDYLLLLGANPWASNGSLATAPDWPGRLEAILARGGRVVVIDPRRTRTAEAASEHHAIVPGTDAHLLFAIVHTLFDEDLVELGGGAARGADQGSRRRAASTVDAGGGAARGADQGSRLDGLVEGLAEVEQLARDFAPEVVAATCGVDAGVIRRLARELAHAERGVVYGRIGTTTQEFGTLASWLVDVCNVLTGNLDRPGGAMFTRAALGAANTRGAPGVGRGVELGRRVSRVRSLPETFGELPAVCLAEEIDSAGDGKIRVLITLAGNPVLSIPNGDRLDAALDGLDFMVSFDIYVNETTRHADVVLPSASPLAKSHYDLALLQLAVRNVANYSPPVLPLGPDELDDWVIVSKLALIAQGLGAAADPSLADDLAIRSLVDSAVSDEHSPVHGRDPEEILDALAPRVGPERILDFMARTGPYGDGFGAPGAAGDLTLDVLLEHPHGIDFGALEPRLPEALRTPSGKIELAPEVLVEDTARLRASLGRDRDGLVLVGRRDLRSNNSWMHNLNVLVKGKARCTLQIHPDDATRLDLTDGADAKVASRTGAVVVPVEVTDGIRPGVVSIPHGWGHALDGVELAVARANAGVNSNLLADEDLFDPVSGNAVLNGIPVSVSGA
jgi:anaerobic selenocysteine-containing dehydrogenase